MILKRFYDEKLAQASYLVGCGATGEALIVDPNRDVEPFLEAAGRAGLRIVHVTETHIHADFVSGSRELAARTGARLYLSDEGGEAWRYAFAREARATLLRDGDSFRVGKVRLDVLHTPGHTPEHLSFLVTDEAAADRPMGAFTGDFVFVGDVGRPDLLERAAGVRGTMRDAARFLYRSIQRFKELPDWLQLWPAHGAGSACGKALGAVPQTTLGYERLFNWAFVAQDEEAFVEEVLAGQPDPPRYFAEMKRVNRKGPALRGSLRRPEHLQATRLAELLHEGAIVVDTRPAPAHASARVPGTLNIPLNQSFPTWAGWLLPYDRDLYLIVDGRESGGLDQALRDLGRIGLDGVAGYFDREVVGGWSDAGGALEKVPQVTPSELAERLASGAAFVIDVRNRSEWEVGHIRGALHVPLGHLEERLSEVPTDKPVIVHCQAGGRSAIAASLLLRRGYRDVTNLAGGFGAWTEAGQRVERAEAFTAA